MRASTRWTNWRLLLPAGVLVAASCGVEVSVSPTETAPASSTVDAEPVLDVELVAPTSEPADEASTAPEPPSGTVVARVDEGSLVAHVQPDSASDVVADLVAPVPHGGALVLQVLTPFVAPAPEWLEVRLPVRPNGTTGWIRSAEVDLSLNPYRIEITTSDFQLDLFRNDELVLSTPIAVGTGETPTPYGEFYLAELLQPPSPDGPYGPFAFGLSGFSDVLYSFAGGEGVIGIHGTNDPSVLGTDVSHGCVRVDNDVITEMAATVPLGTPVSIQH